MNGILHAVMALVVTVSLLGCNVLQSVEPPEFADVTIDEDGGKVPDAGGTSDAGGDAADDAASSCDPCLTVSAEIASSDGDAEECPDGEVGYADPSLQLTRDDDPACDGEQVVGLFFQSVELPAGATVHEATIQFTAAESGAEPTDLVIWGEAGINPPDFDDLDSNVSNRPRLAENVSWTAVPDWQQGDAGPAQRTPDLSSIVQELVDQPGWASGNGMTFIVTGTGQRVAVAFDAEPDEAAKLTVRYSQ